MQPIAALLVHRLEDLVGGVETDEVKQGERPHGEAAAQLHRRVDVLARCVLRLEHVGGVVEVAEQQGVGDEPRLVAHDDRELVEGPRDSFDVGHHVIGGHDGLHDLDELQDRCRVEEVHAHDLRRPLRRHGDVGHREGRGVGGQNRVGGDGLVELFEDDALELEALRHSLDHELTVGHVVVRRREANASEDRLALFFGGLPARDRAAGRAFDVALTARHGGFVRIEADDVVATAGEDLDDSGTHGAETDDADAGDVARHGRS